MASDIPKSSAPPPTRVTPVSTRSAAISGGDSSKIDRTPSQIVRTVPCKDSRISIEVTVVPDEFQVEVYYVQPERTAGRNCIDFESFASVVSRHDNPFSHVFARHFRRTMTAGAPPPS